MADGGYDNSRCPMGVQNAERIDALRTQMAEVRKELETMRLDWKRMLILAIVCLLGAGGGEAIITAVKEMMR